MGKKSLHKRNRQRRYAYMVGSAKQNPKTRDYKIRAYLINLLNEYARLPGMTEERLYKILNQNRIIQEWRKSYGKRIGYETFDKILRNRIRDALKKINKNQDNNTFVK